jgi:hypothetical protein
MEISTAVALGLVLCIALWVPFFVVNIRRGKAPGHTWFTWWKPRGHPDIGPDIGGMPWHAGVVMEARDLEAASTCVQSG